MAAARFVATTSWSSSVTTAARGAATRGLMGVDNVASTSLRNGLCATELVSSWVCGVRRWRSCSSSDLTRRGADGEVEGGAAAAASMRRPRPTWAALESMHNKDTGRRAHTWPQSVHDKIQQEERRVDDGDGIRHDVSDGSTTSSSGRGGGGGGGKGVVAGDEEFVAQSSGMTNVQGGMQRPFSDNGSVRGASPQMPWTGEPRSMVTLMTDFEEQRRARVERARRKVLMAGKPDEFAEAFTSGHIQRYYNETPYNDYANTSGDVITYEKPLSVDDFGGSISRGGVAAAGEEEPIVYENHVSENGYKVEGTSVNVNFETGDSLEAQQQRLETRVLEEAVSKIRGDADELQERLEDEARRISQEERGKDARSTMARGAANELPMVRRLFAQWFKPLSEAIEAEQKAILNNVKKMDRNVYGPYLLLLDPDKLSVITMSCVIVSMLSKVSDRRFDVDKGVGRLASMAVSIGKCIQAEVNVERIRAKIQRHRLKSNPKFLKPSEDQDNVRDVPDDEEADRLAQMPTKEARSFAHRDWKLIQRYNSKKHNIHIINRHARKALSDDCAVWDAKLNAKIGACLITLLLDTAKIERKDSDGIVRLVPAFQHVYRTDKATGLAMMSHRYGAIRLHEDVVRRAWNGGGYIIEPKFLPMVVEPKKWTKYNEGGYLTHRHIMVRSRSQGVYSRIEKSCREGKMTKVYDALNAIGETGWKIHGRILDVVEELIQRGGDVAGLPMMTNPPIPARLGSTVWGLHRNNDQMLIGSHAPPVWQVFRQQSKMNKVRMEIRELASLRCDLEYKLATARRFRNVSHFYYPHTLDFRGRAYPMHPHLNHLSSDVCRGLLTFSEARPLGEKGLMWLKTQIANLYGRGADKLSMGDRVKFAEQHMDDIFDSADNPTSGRMWWAEAEGPFQCLATCMEIVNAVRSGDPSSFLSSLHVHQDGSCNGLQHYAALGRDETGASAVNLTPHEKPADVYSEIAALVAARVEKDVEKGVKEAMLLRPEVDRKLIKQTVMTSVYGVTFIGARAQIESRLRERGWVKNRDLQLVSKYATKVTFDSLHEMFSSAKDIMHWLGACAKVVADSGQAMSWTTPLGLPVLQPYRQRQRYSVRTVLQSIVVMKDRESLPISAARQRSAFPPNFIHSIDSTHMMMTATDCKEAGLTFAGVHDSFWTHAGTVDEMNTIIRDTFIELHSKPLLDDLKDELENEFQGLEFPPLPELGKFDLSEVRDSNYFFS